MPQGLRVVPAGHGSHRVKDVLYRAPYAREWKKIPLEQAMDMVAERVKYHQQCNPARLEWNRRDNRYHRAYGDAAHPFVLTTYRLTEFCEVSPELAQERNLTHGGFGVPLTGYTAVLLTNSANPVWSGARMSLPALFIASGMAAAGGLLSLLPLERRSTRIARRYALFGRIGELAAGVAMERELSRNPRAKQKLHTGVAGALFRASRVATISSVLLSFGRRTQRLADVAGLAGALALRFAVLHAGKAGARDPRAAT